MVIIENLCTLRCGRDEPQNKEAGPETHDELENAI
jgi:hypothetical protein